MFAFYAKSDDTIFLNISFRRTSIEDVIPIVYKKNILFNLVKLVEKYIKEKNIEIPTAIVQENSWCPLNILLKRNHKERL